MPQSLPVIIGAVGTGVSVYGAYAQGQQQKAAANYSAKVASNNAKIERQNAEIARKDAAREARYQIHENRRLLASQRVAFASAGVATGTGTPLAVEAETVFNENLRIQEIMRQGGYQSRNALARANSYSAQSAADQYSGQQAYRAGITGAASSLISGVGDYYSTKRAPTSQPSSYYKGKPVYKAQLY